MALIDDPKTWILRLFEMEIREGRGADCARFANGFRSSDLPLEEGENVYGIYKNKYYFTPLALMIRNPDRTERIRWADITSCSTRFGEGGEFSEVTLRNGRKIQVRVGDLAKNWTGRISQLFHQMIERHGHSASLGRPLMSAEEFFGKADDAYCIAPNLEPHPSLEEFSKAMSALQTTDSELIVLFSVFDDDDPPVCGEIIMVASLPQSALQEFISRFRADGVIPADENTLRKVGNISREFNVWKIIWD